jgi:hypothetical protein
MHAFIGYYSKRRKTIMQVIHLGQKELAERWRMSEATLERWRSDRIGPVFLKIRGRVLYRHVDIEAFEVASLKGTFVEHGNDQKTMDSSSPELALARSGTQSPALTRNSLLDCGSALTTESHRGDSPPPDPQAMFKLNR